MSARPAAGDPLAPDHGSTAAGVEAHRVRGMGAGALTRDQHPVDRGVGPEDAGHPGAARQADPALQSPSWAPHTRAATPGASGGGGGFRRHAPAAGGSSDVEPPDDARKAIPGKPCEAGGGPGFGLMVLSAGVDALYASAVGAVAPCHLATAKGRKADAAAEEQAVIWEPEGAGRAFLVRPHGWRGFPIWLTSPAMDVCMGGGRALPALYLWLQAPFIHQVGVEVAVGEAERVRMALVREPERTADLDRDWPRPDCWPPDPLPPTGPPPLGASLNASRIDLYVDTQGWEPTREDFPRFVCRAQRKTEFEGARQLHSRGRRLEGFMFGRGAIAARIYDKTLELASRGETWPHAIWKGVDPDRHVWRVELQFRRPALKSFRLKTVADVLTAREELWDYGMRWISLRVPNGDTNRSRWPEAPVWAALRETAMGSPRSELVRERREAASKLRLLRGFVGYATSLAACDKADDVEDAVGALPEVSAYLARKGMTFEDVVTVKREQRLAL